MGRYQKLWTKPEEKQLKNMTDNGESIAFIAIELKRSIGSVQQKRVSMGWVEPRVLQVNKKQRLERIVKLLKKGHSVPLDIYKRLGYNKPNYWLVCREIKRLKLSLIESNV